MHAKDTRNTRLLELIDVAMYAVDLNERIRALRALSVELPPQCANCGHDNGFDLVAGPDLHGYAAWICDRDCKPIAHVTIAA
jgi:hypothetical protein